MTNMKADKELVKKKKEKKNLLFAFTALYHAFTFFSRTISVMSTTTTLVAMICVSFRGFVCVHVKNA